MDTLPILIHPGYPRTATTTIQMSLERDPGNLLFLGRGPTMSAAAGGWSSEAVAKTFATLTDLELPEVDGTSVMREIAARIASLQMRLVVFSDERICKPPQSLDSDWRDRQAVRIKQLFPSAHILLTVRRQDRLLLSLYGRYLSRARNESRHLAFAEWLEAGGGSDYAHWRQRFDFLSYYRSMANTFGPERVHVRAYETYSSNPDVLIDVFRTITADIHCTLDFSRKINSSTRRAHAMDWLIGWGRERIRRLKPFPGHDTPSRAAGLEPALVRVRDHFRSGNELLCRESGVSLPGYF